MCECVKYIMQPYFVHKKFTVGTYYRRPYLPCFGLELKDKCLRMGKNVPNHMAILLAIISFVELPK